MAGVGTGAGDQGWAGGWAPAGAGYKGEETRPAPPPRGREGSQGRGRGSTGGQWELLLLLGNGVWNTCSTSVML